MNRHGGYTLLEMVVVLALLALATAMVAPAGYRMIQSWRDASEVDAVLGELGALSWRARAEGRTFQSPAGARIPADTTEPAQGDPVAKPDFAIALPEGWSLVFREPLTVRANGLCHGTEATLTTLRQSIDLRLVAPYCRVERIAASAQ